MKEDFVVVCEVVNEIEAISLQEYLKEAGIESYVRRYAIPGYDSDFIGTGVPGLGTILTGKWGELLVPESKKEEALKIVSELKREAERKG